MTKEYVRHFKDIKKEHLPLVGGKGANLGEMYARFAVPEGFCITIHAFEEFLESRKLRPIIKEKLAQLDVEKTDDLQRVSDELQQLIVKTPIPRHIIDEIKKHHERILGLVAVRSSATAEDLPNASFAGQQATLLSVKGPDGVVDAVRECWASLYTSRAIYYRVKNKFKHEDVSIAVVVQKMVDSQLAGVAFTANPINNDRNQMVIEGAFGLGETVVSGSVTPDTFIVQKKPLKILDTHIGHQRFALYQEKNGGNRRIEFNDEDGSRRKLTDAQVLEIAHETMRIEEHYGSPQDVEWAYDEKNKLHILQSRPITTLKEPERRILANEIMYGREHYDLFFSNQLPPLIALNYADERFFECFEEYCGARYHIISIIQGDWQQKFVRKNDLALLEKAFRHKLAESRWTATLLARYEEGSQKLQEYLQNVELHGEEPLKAIKKVRELSAPLDAMSNMLHLFSSLIGHEFLQQLRKHPEELTIINQNFAFYTQPIKESRFAKMMAKVPTKRLILSEEEKRLSDVLRLGSYVKDDVSFLLDQRNKSLQKSYDAIAERLKCTREDVQYLSIPEIERYVKEEIPEGTIVRRRELTIIHYPGRKMILIDGEKAREMLSRIKDINAEQQETLHGQPASFGTVCGNVCIAQNGREAGEKIHRGDILVASYTAVEYLPAMKKAKAIVTETGGITSHAAIISRELRIPCVIGVKNATTILRNGDLVEVDAEKGIVRKL